MRRPDCGRRSLGPLGWSDTEEQYHSEACDLNRSNPWRFFMLDFVDASEGFLNHIYRMYRNLCKMKAFVIFIECILKNLS